MSYEAWRASFQSGEAAAKAAYDQWQKSLNQQPQGLDSEPTYIDPKGRTWKLFSVKFHHPIDEQTFSFEIWAIDWADAEERVQYLKQNCSLEFQILGKIST